MHVFNALTVVSDRRAVYGTGHEKLVLSSLWRLGQDNPQHQLTIAQAGGSKPLLTLTSRPSSFTLTLTSRPSSFTLTLTSRHLSPFILHSHPHLSPFNLSPFILHSHLALTSRPHLSPFILTQAGGSEPLVMLLRDGSQAVREYALWSLSLALDEGFCTAIIEHGGG